MQVSGRVLYIYTTVNFVGSSKGEISTEDCIKKISETINFAHSQTSYVITGKGL